MAARAIEQQVSAPLRWWETAGDAELAVECGGATHRLRWRRGEVEMLDHPEPEAEEALAALGGDVPPCLAMTKLWDRAIGDGGFLEEWVDDANLGPARLSWLEMALERLRSEGFHEFLRSLPPARAEPMGRFLHRFPRPWLDRAAGTVAEAVVDGDGVVCDNAAGLLRAATTQRVRRAFVASIGRTGTAGLSLGAAALVPLVVDVQPSGSRSERGGSARIDGRLVGPGRGVTITVDDRWLHRVWAAGAAVVDGQLVLAIDERQSDADRRGHREDAGNGPATVTAMARIVSWPGPEPVVERRVLRNDAGGWSLADRT